jgi:hypothetical protein
MRVGRSVGYPEFPARQCHRVSGSGGLVPESTPAASEPKRMASVQQPISTSASHERGVERNREGFPGTAVFRVYTCRGLLLARVEILECLVDQKVEDDHVAFLEKHCPNGHVGPCPADRLRLGRQIERNRDLVRGRPVHLVRG